VVNLVICDRLGLNTPPRPPKTNWCGGTSRPSAPIRDGPRAIAVLLALIAASGTVGEWNNWILFTHGCPSGKDPQFHMDDGFFIFKLPFLSFLVSWFLVSLVVI